MSSDVLRLFLAVPLHEVFLKEIKEILFPLSAKLPGVKWAEPSQVHITLHFFGDTPASEVERIDQAANSVLPRFRPMEAKLTGVGGFPDLKRPHVIWVGVEETTGTLLELQKAVSQEIRKLGFEIEDRPFKPHATIGRVKKPTRGVSVPDEVKKIRCSLPTVSKGLDHFVLYQSRLLPEGARYEVLKTYQLSKPS